MFQVPSQEAGNGLLRPPSDGGWAAGQDYSSGGGEMTPTMKLRFVERKITESFDSGEPNFAVIRITKILQQWWEVPDVDIPDCGEWRDVPVEDEK